MKRGARARGDAAPPPIAASQPAPTRRPRRLVGFRGPRAGPRSPRRLPTSKRSRTRVCPTRASGARPSSSPT